MAQYTIDVERINRQHGYHFFDAATMKSFNSKIESEVYDNLCFVTSERDKGFWREGHKCAAWDGKRRYTVRVFNPATGEIDTVSEFGQFATLSAAKRFCEKITIEAPETQLS